MTDFAQLDELSPQAAQDTKLKSEVYNGERTIKDKNFGLVIGTLLAVQVILSIVIIISAKSSETIQGEAQVLVDNGQCDGATPELLLVAISDMSSELADESGVDMGVLLEKYIGQFVGFILGALALSAAWVYYLRAQARCAVWTSLLAKVVIVSLGGVYCMSEGQTEAAVIAFLYAGIVSYLLFRMRDKVDISAEVLREACKAFIETKYMLAWSMLLQFYLLGYLALNAVSLLFGVRVGSVTVENVTGLCDWTEDGWVNPARYFNGFMLIWGILQIEAVRLYMVSFSVGCWYFENESNPAADQVVKTGIKYAFTKNYGTLAIGSFIMALAEALQRAARNPRTPSGCVLWIFVKIFQTCVNFLTKFALILSAIAGTSFRGSLPLASGLLKRHFVGGYVADRVSVNALEGFALIMSIATAFLSGVVIDVSEGLDPLSKGFFDSSKILGAVVYLFSMSLIKYKMLGLLLFILFPSIFVYMLGEGMALGIFIGILSSSIYYFMANVILDHVSAVFVCYAIDRDNGGTSKHTNAIDKVMKSVDGYKEMTEMVHVSQGTA